jgi:hypothetical protein
MSARADPRGGRSAMVVPTATVNHNRPAFLNRRQFSKGIPDSSTSIRAQRFKHDTFFDPVLRIARWEFTKHMIRFRDEFPDNCGPPGWFCRNTRRGCSRHASQILEGFPRHNHKCSCASSFLKSASLRKPS